MPVITALRGLRLRREDPSEFEASLGQMVRPCLKKIKIKKLSILPNNQMPFFFEALGTWCVLGEC